MSSPFLTEPVNYGDWDFRISDLAKSLMELIFNPCGEYR